MQSERGGDHIDAAIDAAARSLTTGEPSAALRMGVRDRISERSPVASAFPFFVASAFRRKAGWWLVPASVTVAVITVMIVGRALLDPPGGSDKTRPTLPDVGRTLSGPPGGSDKTRPTLPSVEPTLSGPPGWRDKARPTVKSPQPLAAATLDLPLEELEPLIPPITIEPLETELIAVEMSSGVMPIEIEPLRIEPLRGGD